jgi:hypothetical protein
MKLVLDRMQWARGNSPNNVGISMFQERSAKPACMCCLGYACAQSGVHRDSLDALGEPFEVANGERRSEYGPGANHADVYEDTRVPHFLIKPDRLLAHEDPFIGSVIASKCIDINDDEETTDEEKIAQLREALAPYDWEVELVDTPEEREAAGGLPVGFGTTIKQIQVSK